jgi:hypothetical protein
MAGSFKPVSQGALLSRAALRKQGLDEDQRVAVVRTTTAALETRADFIGEIRRLWEDAQRRFLTIGRYLNAAKQRLPHGEFELMIASELPFTRQTAFYLRAAAAAIDAGRLLESEVPNSYATVYQLATLEEDQLALARQRDLVRPTVTRDEVLAFKRSLKPAPRNDGRTALQQRRNRILAEMERLRAELEEVERVLGTVTIDGTAQMVSGA